jgi:GNAT superfamily N-acetyltransferase
MIIQNSNQEDIAFIFELFRKAVEYQKDKGYNLWPNFEVSLIEREIKEKRHWKIVDGNTIACIFSVQYNDPIIWQEKDKDPAVYLHRITINPSFKGKGLIEYVKNWAIAHAKEKEKKYLRMDTWGDNETLRNYYIDCGFNYIGQQFLQHSDVDHKHYGGLILSLFENEV